MNRVWPRKYVVLVSIAAAFVNIIAYAVLSSYLHNTYMSVVTEFRGGSQAEVVAVAITNLISLFPAYYITGLVIRRQCLNPLWMLKLFAGVSFLLWLSHWYIDGAGMFSWLYGTYYWLYEVSKYFVGMACLFLGYRFPIGKSENHLTRR